MSSADVAGFQRLQCGVRQAEQPQRVGHSAAALAHGLRHPFLIQAVLHQRLVGAGFFQRAEVLALQVLDNGDFQRFPVRQVADDDRQFIHPGQLRGPPAALPRHNFKGVAARAYQQRLQDAFFTDALGQLGQGGRLEHLPGLVGRLHHPAGGKQLHATALLLLFGGRLYFGGAGATSFLAAQQSVQATAQAGFFRTFGHAPSPPRPSAGRRRPPANWERTG